MPKNNRKIKINSDKKLTTTFTNVAHLYGDNVDASQYKS